jgi:organic hydroperoxide reductase OsmC/OhrA
MQNLPHRYAVEAFGSSEGPIAITSKGLETLSTDAPAQFGGPGDRWSPETLLVASVVNCFVLTFRAVARASSVDWIDLRCDGEGILDRVDRTFRFTGITLRAALAIPAGGDVARATKLLEKSERSCLITNSLACPVRLEPQVDIRAEREAGAA